MPSVYTKQSMILLGTLVVIVTGGDAVITWFFPTWVQHFIRINYFFLAIALFVIFSRVGNIRLGTQPRHSFLKWFLLILSAELFSVLMFINILQVSYAYVPLSIFAEHITTPSASHIVDLLVNEWGLFPWPLIALLAGFLGASHFNEEKPAILSIFFPSLRHRYYDLFFKRVINGFFVIETNFAFILSLVTIALVVNLLFMRVFGITDSVYLRIVSVMFLALLSLFAVTKIMYALVNFSVKQTRSMALSYLFFTLCLLITVLMAYYLAHLLMAYDKHLPTIALTPNRFVTIHWDIFFWGWWICWVPFFASVVARLSQGRTLREIIVAMLILPVIAGIVYNTGIISSIGTASLFANPLLAISSSLFILLYLHREHSADHLVFGVMPVRHNIIATPLKQSNSTITLLKVTITIYATFILHSASAVLFLVSLISLPNTVYFIVCTLQFLLSHSTREKQ